MAVQQFDPSGHNIKAQPTRVAITIVRLINAGALGISKLAPLDGMAVKYPGGHCGGVEDEDEGGGVDTTCVADDVKLSDKGDNRGTEVCRDDEGPVEIISMDVVEKEELSD